MPVKDPVTAAYVRLAADARVARESYDALLTDAEADDDDISTALLAVTEAEKARDRAAQTLKQNRGQGTIPGRMARRSSRQTNDHQEDDQVALPSAHLPSQSDANEDSDLRGGGHTFRFSGRQREQVAEVLELLGAPARTATVIAAARYLHGRELTSAQLVQLRREEQRQYRRASDEGGHATLRPWYVAPCLSGDTLSSAAGTYALSTWTIQDRLITPYSPRLWVAQSVRNLAAAMLRSPSGVDGISSLLHTLLRGTSWGRGSHASPIRPGSKISTAQWLQTVLADASTDAESLKHEHTRAAAEAVDRLKALAGREPDVELWGLPRPVEVRSRGDGA